MYYNEERVAVCFDANELEEIIYALKKVNKAGTIHAATVEIVKSVVERMVNSSIEHQLNISWAGSIQDGAFTKEQAKAIRHCLETADPIVSKAVYKLLEGGRRMLMTTAEKGSLYDLGDTRTTAVALWDMSRCENVNSSVHVVIGRFNRRRIAVCGARPPFGGRYWHVHDMAESPPTCTRCVRSVVTWRITHGIGDQEAAPRATSRAVL